MRDNGGVENGGNDTSASMVFYVTFSDAIFTDGFEAVSDLTVSDYIQSIAAIHVDYLVPIYNDNYQHIEFYGHILGLNQGYPSHPNPTHIKQWLNTILNLMYPDSPLIFAD